MTQRSSSILSVSILLSNMINLLSNKYTMFHKNTIFFVLCVLFYFYLAGLLVWCQAVETLTELTNLGQNVSIN